MDRRGINYKTVGMSPGHRGKTAGEMEMEMDKRAVKVSVFQCYKNVTFF